MFFNKDNFNLEDRLTPSAPDWGVPVEVTYGDFNGDGNHSDVAYVAGQGGSVRIEVTTLINNESIILLDKVLFDPDFRGGGRVTTLLNNNGPDKLVVVPGNGGGPVISIINLSNNEITYQKATPYPDEFRGGLYVTTTDLDRDGKDEIILLPGEGGGPHLVALDGVTFQEKASFFVGPEDDRSGTYFFTPAGGDVTFPGNITGITIDHNNNSQSFTWSGNVVTLDHF